MRTVEGPTDRIVIVGAGLAGLSAALRLAGAGRSVTVVERDAGPGGCAGVVTDGGYTLDTGPTVLTMPDLIEEALACVGERLADRLRLRRLDVAYRGLFADGSRLDIRSSPEATAAEIERLCGAREAAGFLRFAGFAERLYRYEMRSFIDRNTDSPLALLGGDLARITAMGAFRRLDRLVGRYLRDDRTRRMLTFQALYAGVAPQRALGVYAVIPYMDAVAGVYAVDGGMGALPRALAGAAEAAGVSFRYGCEATGVVRSARRLRAVTTADGGRVEGDTFVFATDLREAWRLLGRTPVTARRLRYSPSCFLLLAGTRTAYPDGVHHTIHFGRAWAETFEELTRRGRLMSDPSFLVSRPALSDPSLAAPGGEVFYVLFPTPNGGAPGLDWTGGLRERYRDHVVHTLEKCGYPSFGTRIEVEHVRTPADWAARGMAHGTPFALAHTLAQTGPFRPGNLATGVENVVLAGAGTRPGVGVPTVLVSGRLAAQRVTG